MQGYWDYHDIILTDAGIETLEAAIAQVKELRRERMASNYQNPRTCIVCGEPDMHNGPGSHLDYCRKHRAEVEYARKFKGNLMDAIRNQLAMLTG